MQPVKPAQRSGASIQICSPIVELRQYTLYPGTRDAFVELFDREFVETQEAAGMRTIGQFRDLGDPNRFVWLRGYPDMPAREKALTAFYMHGDAWKTHSETARGMMIDSADALLLRPVHENTSFRLEPPARRAALNSSLPRASSSRRSIRCPIRPTRRSWHSSTTWSLRSSSTPGRHCYPRSSPSTARTISHVCHCARARTSSFRSRALEVWRRITST